MNQNQHLPPAVSFFSFHGVLQDRYFAQDTLVRLEQEVAVLACSSGSLTQL
jgi:hypothetical protein